MANHASANMSKVSVARVSHGVLLGVFLGPIAEWFKYIAAFGLGLTNLYLPTFQVIYDGAIFGLRCGILTALFGRRLWLAIVVPALTEAVVFMIKHMTGRGPDPSELFTVGGYFVIDILKAGVSGWLIHRGLRRWEESAQTYVRQER